MQYRQAPWAIFWAILTKFGMGRVSQVRSLTPNFTVVALKMWAYASKSPKIGTFRYKFAPYVIFTKFDTGRNSQAHSPAPMCQI